MKRPFYHFFFLISISLFSILPTQAQIAIQTWDFDLNTGTLSFTINGVSSVSISNIDCSKFYLQGAQAPAGQTVPQVQLSGCTPGIPNGNKFSLQLSNQVLDNVKLNAGIGTTLADTFLSIESGNGVEEGSNELRAYSQQDADQASQFIVCLIVGRGR